MDSPRLRPLYQPHRTEARTTADTLARAFRDNPLNRAVIGGSAEKRRRANHHGMRLLLGTACTGPEVAWVQVARPAGERESESAGVAGALLAVPPGGYPLPPPALSAQLRCFWGQGWRTMQRWGEVYRALESVHPLEAHWYLSILGVAPEHQKTGVGSSLLRAFASRVDADGAAAYLESDRPENVPFYERVGFEVARETRVMDVVVYCMWRRPK